MFEVNCLIASENKNDSKKLVVKSISPKLAVKIKYYNCVDITIGDSKIRVYAPDLIQALENCINNDPMYRARRGRYNGHSSSALEDEEE